MDGGVWVMVIFAIGILVALGVSLLTIVLRQVREGDIAWLPAMRETSRPAERAEGVRSGARGRSR